MPLNFPDTPSLNQVYTSGSNSWQFDGTVWNALSSALIVSSVGPTGATGATGSFNSTTQTINFTEYTDGIYIVLQGLGADVSSTLKYVENNETLTVTIDTASRSYTIGNVEYVKSYYNSSTGLWDAIFILNSPFTSSTVVYSAQNVINETITGVNISELGDFWNTFGSTYVNHKEGTYTVKTITGQSWVAADTYITCKCLGLTSADHDAEDAIIEGVRFEINNIVPGTGFDIIGHAPEGTYGKYQIKCLGQ